MRLSAGAYGLFRLDGTCITRSEAAALGVCLTETPVSALLAGADPLEPRSVYQQRDGDSLALLIGHIDEAALLAARLALPPSTSPLDLALSALDRFGDDLPREMLGGWVLVRWDARPRRLTIAKSINRSPPILVARAGPRVAIAPDIQLLAALPWVSDAIDGASLPTVLANHRLMPDPAAPTMLRQVRELSRACVARIDSEREQVIVSDPHLPFEPWAGSFDDAMVATDALLRDIVGGMVNRAGQIAATLSGGLDSSLLSWLATTLMPPGETLPLLCWTGAPERDLPSDAPNARLVAEHLGQPLHVVSAPAVVSPYRASVADFRNGNAPTGSVHQYLYSRAFRHAAGLGVSHLLDGAWGELTVTSHTQLAQNRSRLRTAVGRWRRWLRYPDERLQWPEAAFNTWLAPQLLAQLPHGWVAAHRRAIDSPKTHRSGDAWRYSSALTWSISREWPDQIPGTLRVVSPFLDIRLLRLFAGMPVDFACHDGVHRAPARHLLLGNLPDSIRLMPKLRLGSADYFLHLREHAATAAQRIPVFRKAGIGEWLDLDRIEHGMQNPQRFRHGRWYHSFRTQLGMQTAEYLLWWTAGRPDEANRP